MPLQGTDTVEQVIDKDDEPAAPATDERVEEVRQAADTAAGVETASISTSGTDAEQLPALDVAPGGDLVLRADTENTGIVFVGDENAQDLPLSGGETLIVSVTSADAIWVQTPDVGDSVALLAEVSA